MNEVGVLVLEFWMDWGDEAAAIGLDGHARRSRHIYCPAAAARPPIGIESPPQTLDSV